MTWRKVSPISYYMNFISPQRAANNQIHKNETQIDTRGKKLRHNTKVLEIKKNKDIRNTFK